VRGVAALEAFSPAATSIDQLVSVGASHAVVCGVRAYDDVLRAALGKRGVRVSGAWADVGHSLSLRDRGRRYRNLIGQSDDEPGVGDRWMVLHYSVFGFSYRGLPLFVLPLAWRLRRRGRVCIVLHEMVIPWDWKPGIGSKLVALAQRIVLVPLVWSAEALVVTEEGRRDWLTKHRWFARRPILVVPVPSTLPEPEQAPEVVEGTIGISGYSVGVVDPDLVADAVRQVRDEGVAAAVIMLGAPGPTSELGRSWRTAFEGADVPISFTGVVEAEQLARTYASCHALIQPELIGPSPRRTSFAAAIASRRPVVAFTGEQGWNEVAERRAAALVPPSSEALAARLALLLGDDTEAAEQARRGRQLYDDVSSPDVVAGRLAEFLTSATAS
jgi:glycosyltransferase involved in cell wall biosynthesis